MEWAYYAETTFGVDNVPSVFERFIDSDGTVYTRGEFLETHRIVYPITCSNPFARGHLASTGGLEDKNIWIMYNHLEFFTHAGGDPESNLKTLVEQWLERLNAKKTDKDILTFNATRL